MHFKNWKTTLCGILTLAVQAAHFYPPAVPFIAPVTAILVASGLYVAADASAAPIAPAAPVVTK